MRLPILFSSAVLGITLISCNNGNVKLQERIEAADSVAINYFTGDGRMDTVVSVTIISKKETIVQLTTLVAEKRSAAASNCGYDGSLHFFKNNSVVEDIYFRMNDPECRYFSFVQDGKPVATILSNKAADLLIALKNTPLTK